VLIRTDGAVPVLAPGGTFRIPKAALILLTQGLAQGLVPVGIRVSALAPGLVRIDFSAAPRQSPALAEGVVARMPFKRLGEPEDIVGAALFLASPASAYINGAVITVDGGLLAVGPLR
jgi:NAD(P)-dependent dehydrogenase (short-subunit alcohol dehydrogenase family)